MRQPEPLDYECRRPDENRRVRRQSGRLVITSWALCACATLFAVDFGELLSDPSKLAALQTLRPGVDFDTVRKTLGQGGSLPGSAPPSADS